MIRRTSCVAGRGIVLAAEMERLPVIMMDAHLAAGAGAGSVPQ
jgi:hypothetical protein